MRFALCLVRKLACRRTTFSSAANPTHATARAMHFPANAGLIFLTDELTNDRYLVDTGATLSIVPCSQNSSPSGPLLKRADWQPIPSWGFFKKLCNSNASILQLPFCKPLWLVPFWHWLFEKIQSYCFSRNQPNTVCLLCSGLTRPTFAFNILSSPIRLAFFI